MFEPLNEAEIPRANAAVEGYAKMRGWSPFDPLIRQLWFVLIGSAPRQQLLEWLEDQLEDEHSEAHANDGFCLQCRGNGTIVTGYAHGEEVLSTCSLCSGKGTRRVV